MGGSEFSVLTTAKWIFDAESEKLRADFFKHAENTKSWLKSVTSL
jgi:hypothetical protein